jgi:2-amino-4-hydroxy-6-hydroxymethyldihydropteridine diphosphokinase
LNSLHHTYISLGSNQGDRLESIQNAINAIYQEIGAVVAVSKVYQTQAWGFKSDDFLNCCVAVATALDPHDLLDTLLAIEITLGRVRSDKKGYEARPIDLDIISYAGHVINSKNLVVPHPEMHHRRFVLAPLHDIAPHFIHPIFKESVTVLLAKVADKSPIKPINISLKNPSRRHEIAYNFITIEGNIGSGKTSLTKKIAADYNAKLILERFEENAFLPKFYKDQKRFAFPLEMSFLADRYQQLSEDIAQYDLFKEFVIADYHITKSLTFAKITLPEDEFTLYRKFFNVIYKDMPSPDMYLYLHQNTERLVQNIQKRGRDYEQNISFGYLEKINRGYLEFIQSQAQLNIKIVDVSELDFLTKRKDYLTVLDQLAD